MTRVPLSWLAVLVLLAPASAAARTITLTDEDCDQMACIAEASPRHGWLGWQPATGAWSNASLYLYKNQALLMRWPLDAIPPGQRVTKAELAFPPAHAGPGEQKLLARRILGPWGAGVSWQYRQVRPQRLEWTVPGGTAGGKDRVARPTAVGRGSGPCELTFNLTEDVELWYSGAAKNYGWMFTMDDPEGVVYFGSPTWTNAGNFKLRITYEPK